MIIVKQNGQRIDLLKDAGMRTINIDIPSPNIVNVTDTVEGASGVIDYGSQIGLRVITVDLRLTARTAQLFSLVRDEVFNLLSSTEPFYIIEKRLLGKMWLVRSDGSFNVPQRGIIGDASVKLLAVKGYAESAKSSLNLEEKGALFADDTWNFGSGLDVTEGRFKYTHDVLKDGTFEIWNLGDLPVHPFESELLIKISEVIGGQTQFQLTNLTNGSRARIEVPIPHSDVWRYDGPNVTKNGTSALRDTRKDFMYLSPGLNRIQMFYATSATISFDFKFLYK